MFLPIELQLFFLDLLDQTERTVRRMDEFFNAAH